MKSDLAFTPSSAELQEKKESLSWQEGCGVFSVSYSALNEVTRYINRQREHHAKADFKNELTTFLKNHQIEFDAEKIWWP